MAKVRLTKYELKKQQDDLKRFVRFLPMLELKARQLLLEINRVRAELELLDAEIGDFDGAVESWVAVFAEPVDLHALFTVAEVVEDTDNVAGVDLPVLVDVIFENADYDLFATPVWVDRGIATCKTRMRLVVARQVALRQLALLRDEWRITSQRIKLFEEVKIPRARESIRRIRIFLGDQQTAAVVRGKIAKAGIERRERSSGLT